MTKQNTLKKSETDWERIDAMTDEDIDYSDIPKITEEMWAKGVWRKGLKPTPNKSQITLRIDQDVIEFFKAQGRGYQTKINQLLRAYMEAHENK
ncbi:MAG: BrnA antitoxin family protein [Acidobacteriota bacterium]